MSTTESTAAGIRDLTVSTAGTGLDALTADARQAKKNGQSAVQAAPGLLNRHPGTPAEQMGRVLAAVWPEARKGEGLTAALLACCPPYSKDEIPPVVKRVVGYYHDVYVRDGFDDDGRIPSPTLDAHLSPDIIPFGIDPSTQPDEPGTFFSGKAYDPPDMGKNVVQERTNYLYVRARNLFPGPQSGRLLLYAAPAALLLKPSNWRDKPLTNIEGGTYFEFSGLPAAKVVVSKAFLWNPRALDPGQHYCTIARVSTDENPNPIPPDDQLKDFVKWVRENAGIAWRNVHMVKADGAKTVRLRFGNPDPQPRRFVISARWEDVPDGTTVAMVCAKPGPDAPIRCLGTAGKDTAVTWLGTLPAAFDAVLDVTISPSAAKPLPKKANVIVSFSVVPDGDAALAAYAEPAEAVGVPAAALALAADGEAVPDLTFLGNFHVVLEP